MTRTEFSNAMSWLTLAIGKPIANGTGKDAQIERDARMEVYFELIGHLPYGVLMIAAKRVALAHPWATFPSVAELSEMAAASSQGEIQALTAGEAWGMALVVAKKIDPDHRGPYYGRGKDGKARLFDSQVQCFCDGLPGIVVEAMRAFGITELANANANFARNEFVEIFDGLAAREQKRRLLPGHVAKALEQVGERNALPAPVAGALKTIGSSP